MRIGYCTNLIATQIDGTGSEWIEKGRETGLIMLSCRLHK